MLLAQSNIALFRWPLTDPRMAGFVSQIDTMNLLAESSHGFVWRFTDPYESTGLPTPFGDPLLFFNMSVWRDVESLRSYVFQSEHVEMLQRKSEWTRPTGTPPLVMWWLDDDEAMPTVHDAIARFEALQNDSNSGDVFTFSERSPEQRD